MIQNQRADQCGSKTQFIVQDQGDITCWCSLWSDLMCKNCARNGFLWWINILKIIQYDLQYDAVLVDNQFGAAPILLCYCWLFFLLKYTMNDISKSIFNHEIVVAIISQNNLSAKIAIRSFACACQNQKKKTNNHLQFRFLIFFLFFVCGMKKKVQNK